MIRKGNNIMKRKNNTMIPEPLKLINRVKASVKGYGDVFRIFDTFRAARYENDLVWDETKCYLPLQVFMEITKFLNRDKFNDDIAYDAVAMFHTYNWRLHKQIYSFDSEFADVLVQTDSSDIDTSVFENLPYNSFYVDIPNGCICYDSNGEVLCTVSGFFCSRNVSMRSATDDLLDCIMLYFVTDQNHVIACPLKVKQGVTVKESTDSYMETLYYATNDLTDVDESYHEVTKMVPYLLNNATQLILYLCSMNMDITENPEQKKIYRAPSKTSKPQDKLSEVRKWDVGYRIGQVIRKTKQTESENTTTSVCHKSSAKRPHSRRGHFHHFWVGKRDSAERKLIVKWVAPMYINMKFDEEMPTVINKVEA